MPKQKRQTREAGLDTNANPKKKKITIDDWFVSSYSLERHKTDDIDDAKSSVLKENSNVSKRRKESSVRTVETVQARNSSSKENFDPSPSADHSRPSNQHETVETVQTSEHFDPSPSADHSRPSNQHETVEPVQTSEHFDPSPSADHSRPSNQHETVETVQTSEHFDPSPSADHSRPSNQHETVETVQTSEHFDPSKHLHQENSADGSDSPVQHEANGAIQTTSSTNLTSVGETYTLPKCFEKVGKGRKNIRCKICFQRINVVSTFIDNGKKHVPAICTENGTQNRKATVDQHLQSQCHMSALRSTALASLKSAELVTDDNTIEAGISKQNQQLFNKISRQIVTAYNDAKRGTLSGYSWPSREIAFLKGAEYDSKTKVNFSPKMKFEPKRTDLQYLTPDHHSELLSCIVEVDKPNIKAKLQNALSASIRVDGSVDRTQFHNIHVMVNIIEEDGSTNLIFLGFFEPRGHNTAPEYYNSVKEAVKGIIDWDELICIVSSIATDGENLNSGEKGGLWVLIEKDKKKDGPFIKIWCAVHRQNLAFKAMSNDIPEILELIKDAASLSTHFHSSSVRTHTISSIAETHEFKYVHYPSYFEVRWTEFTSNLIEAILINWRASMQYFVEEKEKHLKDTWQDKNRLHLACLLADLSFIYKRFQKSFESDAMTIFDIQPQITKTIDKFTDLLEKPIASGWEETFLENLSETATRFGKKIYKFHGYILSEGNSRREFSLIRRDAILSIIHFLKEMFECDSTIRQEILPLRKLDPDVSAEDLKKCHKVACPDLDLRTFCQEYFELSCVHEYSECSPAELLKILCRNKNDQFSTIKTALARLIAAKPHSADVERLIHSYNQIKTGDRSSIGPHQLHNQLHVQLNMGPLESFNPEPAAFKWLTAKKRRDRPVTKKKAEGFFKGVFAEADDRKKKPAPQRVGF